MLAGRESLIRLVGKKKKAFSSPLAHQLLQSKNENDLIKEEEGEKEGEAPAPLRKEQQNPEWVSCPVCGASIRGTDQIINSHLDICLTRGTKRKLTQRTLLQLNFSPISGSKSSWGEIDTPRAADRKDELLGGKESTDSYMTIKNHSLKHNDQSQFTSNTPEKYMCNLIKCVDAQLESKVNENTVGCMMSPQSVRLSKIDARGVEDANFLEVVDTFIVGRKFHRNIELQQSAGLLLQRDSQNAKDKHAIKVLSMDSGSGHMVGYLSRELAKFLSPLIDDHHLKCEGTVISLPQHPLDVVPIQLACRKMVVSGEIEYGDKQNFEFLWENVRRVTEYTKINPPSMTKYQQNFCLMLEDVNNHAHLFTSDEKLLLGSFDSLNNDAQRLFIRIYTRKGPWFRVSNISYPEISDLQQAIKELQLAGYISSFSSSEDIFKYNMKEVLGVLTVFEMKEISYTEFSKRAVNYARRQDLIDFLVAAYQDGKCKLLPEIILERVGSCIKISFAADTLLWRVQRLFFLNGEQDLSAFLLSDLGLIKFPDYTCNIKHPIFQKRSDLLEYAEAVEVAQIMDESLDENNLEMVIRCIDVSHKHMQTRSMEATQPSEFDSPPTFFSRFSSSWVYSKVLSLGVSVYERERRFDDAISLLKGLLSKITHESRRGYWTLRLSVDLEHIGRVNESLSVAEEGVVDPWVRAGSRMALQRRVLRLGKPPRRWKTPSYANSIKRTINEVSIRGRPLNCETGSKSLFYGYDGDLCGVEQLALQYYAEEGGGWYGVHSESGIWMTIFGVLMWDVIFSDVPDVFRSKFQMAPLDLFTDDFYIMRKNLIEHQLQKIQEGIVEDILVISWESHIGTACHGVNWDKHSLSDLQAVVSCIGSICLASLCRHLALDYRSWSSGMPDLLLWRFNGGDMHGGEAKLVEVKGPRDRLSEQQRAWMLILMDCGFNVEVCKVSPNAKS